MSWWWTPDCGTPCRIGGHADALFGGEGAAQWKGSSKLRLTDASIVGLFTPSIDEDYDALTPARAAAAIRRLVERHGSDPDGPGEARSDEITGRIGATGKGA